jgi:PKD repeat protein
MKTNLRLSHFGLLIPVFIIFSSVFFSDCKGKAEIHDVIDSVINCEPPFVVHFFAEAEHRTKKLEYTWEFGDGQTSNDQEPVHTYQDFGLYDVKLQIRQNEAIDNFSYVLNLTEEETAPFAEWDYDTDAPNFWEKCIVTFENTSRHATSFLWDFDDGTTSTELAPDHIFETAGIYNVVLNAICQQDTNKLPISIEILPEPTHLYIKQVRLWIPAEYETEDIDLVIRYGSNPSPEEVINLGSFTSPAVIDVEEYISSYFTGFNTDALRFEVWIFGAVNYLDYFSIQSRNLQDDNYPIMIAFDNQNGFALEADITYD